MSVRGLRPPSSASLQAGASLCPGLHQAQCPAKEATSCARLDSATPSPMSLAGSTGIFGKRRLLRLRRQRQGRVMECRSMIRKASDAERDGTRAALEHPMTDDAKMVFGRPVPLVAPNVNSLDVFGQPSRPHPFVHHDTEAIEWARELDRAARSTMMPGRRQSSSRRSRPSQPLRPRRAHWCRSKSAAGEGGGPRLTRNVVALR